MDHLRLQSAFKFVAISRFGDGGQLMTAPNLCLEAVYISTNFQNVNKRSTLHSYLQNKFLASKSSLIVWHMYCKLDTAIIDRTRSFESEYNNSP